MPSFSFFFFFSLSSPSFWSLSFHFRFVFGFLASGFFVQLVRPVGVERDGKGRARADEGGSILIDRARSTSVCPKDRRVNSSWSTSRATPSRLAVSSRHYPNRTIPVRAGIRRYGTVRDAGGQSAARTGRRPPPADQVIVAACEQCTGTAASSRPSSNRSSCSPKKGCRRRSWFGDRTVPLLHCWREIPPSPSFVWFHADNTGRGAGGIVKWRAGWRENTRKFGKKER